MPLQIVHQDITKIACDAIVNPGDFCFSGSGCLPFVVIIVVVIEVVELIAGWIY